MTSQHLKFRVIEGNFAHTSKYRVEVAHNGKLVATVKQLDAQGTTAPKFEPTTVALPPHDAIYDSILLRVIRKSGAMSVRRIIFLCFFPFCLSKTFFFFFSFLFFFVCVSATLTRISSSRRMLSVMCSFRCLPAQCGAAR
jgi:hypothetical protein